MKIVTTYLHTLSMLYNCEQRIRVNIKKSYIFGPLGVSENIILEKVENIPATIHIYTILLNYHLTLAYRDAKYLFHIFEIDKCHWCSSSASNCKVLLLHLLLKIMPTTQMMG